MHTYIDLRQHREKDERRGRLHPIPTSHHVPESFKIQIFTGLPKLFKLF
jgi:hypothetical protein